MNRLNLSDLPKQDPFRSPEGYLDKLPQQIQARLTPRPQTAWAGSNVLALLPRLQLLFSLIILLLTGLFVFVQQDYAEAPEAYTILDDTSEQEIVNYLSGSASLSMQELLEGSRLENDIYAIEFTGEDVLENEIILHIDSYSSEELWK